MTNRKKTNYAQLTSFRRRLPRAAERLAVQAGSRYLYICEDGLVHYCSQQRGFRRAFGRIYDRGREAGVFDGEELRAELHDWVRAPISHIDH